MARADQALEDDLRLDYERPFTKKPLDRSKTIELLLEACRAGHKASCWRAALIAPKDAQATLYATVATNCRDGDQLSCRALPDEIDVEQPLYADLPGALGRSACSGSENKCDVAMLVSECDAGFGMSCYVAGLRAGNSDRARLLAKETSSYKADCAAGIESSCYRMRELDKDEQFEAYRSGCTVTREACSLLGDFYDERSEPAEARDARERGCQFGNNPKVCAQLGAAYLDHKYEEPVPGRGQALVDDACRRLGSYAARVEECKRASK